MKIFVMNECPGCGKVKELLKEYNVESKFTLVDIHDEYDGFLPESVPVLQDAEIGTIKGEQLVNFLNKVYGEE